VPAETLQEQLLAAGAASGGLRFIDPRGGAERESFFAWSVLAERAARVAGGLAALGVAAGETVALVYPTSPEFFDALFGVLLAGAVPVPLYPPVRLGRLAEYQASTARQLAAAEVVLVLADHRLAPLVGEAVATAAPRLGCRALEALPAAPPKRERGRAGDLALVQFSSGTTVDPKPVALEQRAVLAQVAALNSFWRHTPETPQSGVSWLPLYHDMGLIGGVFPALALDATMTLLPPERFVARPALWLRAISRHGATISVAPNFAYALATERIADEELAGCDLSRWWLALCGAETVEAETLRRFADRFARWGFRREALTPVYGLSEAALAVTFGAPDAPFRALRCDRAALAERDEAVEAAGGRELVSVGRPLPGFAIELRDEAGRTVAERRVGRLFVAGPSLFRGYFGRPEATARVLEEGWLDTGDLGFLAGGELFLTGRAKDVLILRGRNHSPADVEQAIDDLVELRRGCAAAVSHHAEGGTTDRLLLFVEHRRGASTAERQRLPARSREAVLQATGLAVDEVHVLLPGTLPRTSSGKIRRGETLRRHLSGELAPPDRAGPLQLVAAFWRGRRALRRALRRTTRQATT